MGERYFVLNIDHFHPYIQIVSLILFFLFALIHALSYVVIQSVLFVAQNAAHHKAVPLILGSFLKLFSILHFSWKLFANRSVNHCYHWFITNQIRLAHLSKYLEIYPCVLCTGAFKNINAKRVEHLYMNLTCFIPELDISKHPTVRFWMWMKKTELIRS